MKTNIVLVFTTIILCFNYPAFARGGGGGHIGGSHSSSWHASSGTPHVNSGVSHI
jgi:hypothetical protein